MSFFLLSFDIGVATYRLHPLLTEDDGARLKVPCVELKLEIRA